MRRSLVEDAAETNECRHKRGVMRRQPGHGLAIDGGFQIRILRDQIADAKVSEKGLLRRGDRGHDRLTSWLIRQPNLRVGSGGVGYRPNFEFQ